MALAVCYIAMAALGRYVASHVKVGILIKWCAAVTQAQGGVQAEEPDEDRVDADCSDPSVLQLGTLFSAGRGVEGDGSSRA